MDLQPSSLPRCQPVNSLANDVGDGAAAAATQRMVQFAGGSCAFAWLPHAEVCGLLSHPSPTTIVFIGDSVTRHFMHGMQLLVRNDYELGAMRPDAVADLPRQCKCNGQFGFKDCRQHILKDTADLGEARACPGARVVFFGVMRSSELNASSISEFVVAQPRALVLLGGYGLHIALQAKPVYYDFVRHIHNLVKHSPHVRTICVGMHATQDNMPEEFKELQSNRKISGYNTLLKRLCRDRGLRFFDTFDATRGAKAMDGVHYGMEVNVAKAQMLMEYVRETAHLPMGGHGLLALLARMLVESVCGTVHMPWAGARLSRS